MTERSSGGPYGPLAGEPRARQPAGAAPAPARRRVATWLAWWVLLMSLWVAADDSFEGDELLAGAGASALAALVAEFALHQAVVRFQIKAAWLARALSLPGQVAHDTWSVFAVLARTVFTRAPAPDGEFREVPVRYGDDSPLGVTRRVLLTGARSLAPNEFVLGMDPDRGVMVTHRLVDRVTAFVVAAVAMLVCLLPAGVVIVRGSLADAVIGFEFLTSVGVMVFALLAEGFQRPSLFEFPVLLAVLLFGSGLVFVRVLERWL